MANCAEYSLHLIDVTPYKAILPLYDFTVSQLMCKCDYRGRPQPSLLTGKWVAQRKREKSTVKGWSAGARERGSAGARERGSAGARERGSAGARERGSAGARERGSAGARAGVTFAYIFNFLLANSL